MKFRKLQVGPRRMSWQDAESNSSLHFRTCKLALPLENYPRYISTLKFDPQRCAKRYIVYKCLLKSKYSGCIINVKSCGTQVPKSSSSHFNTLIFYLAVSFNALENQIHAVIDTASKFSLF